MHKIALLRILPRRISTSVSRVVAIVFARRGLCRQVEREYCVPQLPVWQYEEEIIGSL